MQDSKTVVTGGKDKILRVHNLATSETIAEKFGHGDIITAMAFTSDE